MPRLKYHNPALSTTVSRAVGQDGPATLTVFFADSDAVDAGTATGGRGAGGASAAATVAAGDDGPSQARNTVPTSSTSGDKAPSETYAPTQRTETIDCKNRQPEEILQEFMRVTGAREVPPTEEDREEMRRLRDMDERSGRDSERMREVNRKRRREEELMERARSEVGGGL